MNETAQKREVRLRLGVTFALALVIVTCAILSPAAFSAILQSFTARSLAIGDIYYIAFFTLEIIMVLLLMASSFGKVRLGGPAAEPEFPRPVWLGMIFTSTMGGALMAFSVYQPLAIYANPPIEELSGNFPQAVNLAFFLWGFHGWATWALMAAMMGYCAWNLKQKLGVGGILRALAPNLRNQSAFSSFIIGVEVLAIIMTWFGFATGLAIIIQQVSGGVIELFGLDTTPQDISPFLAAGFCLVISAVAFAGLEKGISIASNINVMGAVVFILFFAVNSTTNVASELIQTILNYAVGVFEIPLKLVLSHDPETVAFRRDSAASFFLWWLTYVVMAGTLFARISLGRTIRELLFFSCLIPVLICGVWFSVMGGMAGNYLESLFSSPEAIGANKSLFLLINQMDYGYPILIFTIVLISAFVVTTGAPTILTLAESTEEEANPTKMSIGIWAVAISVILIFAAGAAEFQSIQQIAIALAIPFQIVFVLMLLVFFVRIHRKGLEE